jgi:ornithine carbamoyltransferase
MIDKLNQELATHSPVPVLNALSSLWHPTQILADMLTLHEHAHLFGPVNNSTNNLVSQISHSLLQFMNNNNRLGLDASATSNCYLAR